MQIKTKRFDKKIPLPRYEKGAAAFDFICRTGAILEPKEIRAIPANIAMKIPEGYALLILPRSSTATRKGLVMPASAGLIDPFWCGDDNEILLIFQNITNAPVQIRKGEKLAQGILIKTETVSFEEVTSLSKSKRVLYKYDKQC